MFYAKSCAWQDIPMYKTLAHKAYPGSGTIFVVVEIIEFSHLQYDAL
jgi:hypothetical protein